MLKRFIWMAVLLVIVFGGTFFGRDWVGKKLAKRFIPKQEPTLVQVQSVQAVAWHPSLDAVGTLTAVHGVNLSAELGGQVTAIAFKNGQKVQKGQLLVQLDNASDVQELKNLQAQLALANQNLQRQRPLYKSGAVAPSDFDSIRSQVKQITAMVSKQKALLAMKAIKAPFAGRVGIAQVHVGAYVSPGTQLVTLQTLDPLYVQFSLPEQVIPQLHVGQPVRVQVDSAGSEVVMGRLTAINAAVDEQTRSILLQATVPNRDGRLYPGSFSSIHVLLPPQKGMLAVPQVAVNYTLYGDTVYVVTHTKKGYIAKQRNVTLGMRQGSDVAVVSGLKPNERVIVAGQLLIHDGQAINPQAAKPQTPKPSMPKPQTPKPPMPKPQTPPAPTVQPQAASK